MKLVLVYQFLFITKKMKHTISVLVENEPGVLTRIAGLFARRGFNIESLSVSPAIDTDISQITMVVYGDNRTIEQVIKQLYKLINVRRVRNFNYTPNITRELMLIKLKISTETRTEILDIIKIFNAKIVDFSQNMIIIEVTGETEKLVSIELQLKKFGIIEYAKTGRIALVRNPDNVEDRTIGV